MGMDQRHEIQQGFNDFVQIVVLVGFVMVVIVAIIVVSVAVWAGSKTH